MDRLAQPLLLNLSNRTVLKARSERQKRPPGLKGTPMAVGKDAVHDDDVARASLIGTALLHEAAARARALPHQIRALAPAIYGVERALPLLVPINDNLWINHAVAEADPGEMLVVEAGDGASFGYWGKIAPPMLNAPC